MKHTVPALALLSTLVVFPACSALAGPTPAPAAKQDPAASAPAPAQAAAPDDKPQGQGQSGPAAPKAGGHGAYAGGMPPFMMPGMEPMDPETQALQKELQKLQLKAQLRQAKLQVELADLTEAGQKLQAQLQSDGSNITLQKEVQKLQAEAALRQAKAQAELAATNEEMNRLQAKMGLDKAKRDAELAAANDEINRLQSKMALDKARRDAERAAAQEAEDKANFELSQKLAERSRRNRELQAQIETLSTEGQLAHAKLSDENRRLDLELKRLQTAMQARETRDKVADMVLTDVVYDDEPFKDGVLTITDRRVELNGVIWDGSVKPVIEKIQFFANQSDKPIFLVIDSSPGGSVASGYQVIKAMESSKAPVHVVVKSFAASMAACICTLAPHSYAYPNAHILHHQLSYGGGGNLTQQREQLEMSQKWYQRLSGPIAKKMGVSVEEMVKEMYKHNSDGDWAEFADDAQKLHWVDNVVKEVRETGVREMPKAGGMAMFPFMLKEEKDAQGHAFVQLPRLEAYDCWFLRNGDGYYRK